MAVLSSIWVCEACEHDADADVSILSGYHIMRDYGYCNKFKIPPSTLEILLGHLEIGYAR